MAKFTDFLVLLIGTNISRKQYIECNNEMDVIAFAK